MCIFIVTASKDCPLFFVIGGDFTGKKYSKFDGFATPLEIARTAKKHGMRAVSINDHGSVAGAIEHIKACRKEDIRPVIGSEMYLSKNHLVHDKKGQPQGKKGNRHINIIAKNLTGLKNLFTLSQKSFLEGYYYDPRIDLELLDKYKEGLIVLSACPNSLINWNIAQGRYEEAKKVVQGFKDVLGEDFYLEIMYHGLGIESRCIPDILKISKEVGVKVCASNDSHYGKKADAEFHDVILCMSTNRCLKDPNRLKFPYAEFYLKSPQEMYDIFKFIPESLKNTVEVAEKCDYSKLTFIEDGGSMKLPKFEIPPEFSNPHDYLEDLAWKGIKRLKLDKSQPHIDRLKLELDDVRLVWNVNKYDFATYFLIIKDIMDFARKNEIDSGIRGSGYGSLLVQCLGISSGVDILEYQLSWPRFLGFDSLYFYMDEDFGVKN